MLDWEGRQIDFVGGGVNFYGMGNQFFRQLPVDALAVEAHELLFACGGAMLVDRAIFLGLGGFDESYFAYFEDVDLAGGWGLRLSRAVRSRGGRLSPAARHIAHHARLPAEHAL